MGNENTNVFLRDFLEFEKANHLINWNINNIPIWELIRFSVFVKIDPIENKLLKTNDKRPHNILVGLKFLLQSVFFRNPFKIKNHVNTIVINHPRRKFDLPSGCYEDIYTDPFLDYIPDEASYIVLENFFQFKHFLPAKTKKIFYLDKINFIAPFLKNICRYHFSPEDHTRIREVESLFKKELGVNVLGLERIIEKEIIAFQYMSGILEQLFIKLKPQRLIVVVSYNSTNKVACIVAKKLNIPVYELQHGLLTESVPYNFPINSTVKSFPNYFVSWGHYWTQNIDFPLGVKILPMGFPYLNEQKKKMGHVKKQKQILVISQLRIDIAEFALQLSELTSYKVLFKPHPSEYAVVHERYRFFKGHANIDILDNPKADIYEYYNTSEFVIGVYSTAVIEALCFDAKIIIAKLPGWEYHKKLVGENVFFAESPQNVLELILKENKKSYFNDDLYFVKIPTSEFVQELFN